MLSERQEKVKSLSAALHKMGVATLNPLPLDEEKKTLDIRIMDSDRDKVLAQLNEWG